MSEPQVPVAVVDDVVLVEHSHFAMQTFPSGTVALDLGIPPAVVLGGAGGATFRSAATDHHAAVRLELWTSAPPPSPGWDAQQDARVTVDALDLRLMSPTAGVADVALRVPRPGVYDLRAFVARSRTPPPRRTTGFPHGFERWLVQVWPA